MLFVFTSNVTAHDVRVIWYIIVSVTQQLVALQCTQQTTTSSFNESASPLEVAGNVLSSDVRHLAVVLRVLVKGVDGGEPWGDQQRGVAGYGVSEGVGGGCVESWETFAAAEGIRLIGRFRLVV